MRNLECFAVVLVFSLLLQVQQRAHAWSGLQGLRSRWSISETMFSPSFFRTAQFPSPIDSRDDIQLNTTLFSPGADRVAHLIQEAEELRVRAKQLMAEALSMEADLKESMSYREKKKKGSSLDLVQRLFDSRPLTPEAVAQAMRTERVSADQAHVLVEQLYAEVLKLDPTTAMGALPSQFKNPAPPASSKKPSSDSPPDASDSASLIASRLECFIDAAGVLDTQSFEEMKVRWPGRVASSLRSHLSQLRRTSEFNLARSARLQQHETAHQLSQKSGSQQQRTTSVVAASSSAKIPNKTMESKNANQGAFLPTWLPPRFVVLFDNKTLAQVKSPSPDSADHPLSPRDISIIRQKVFTETRFVCTSSESLPSAVIFRGNIRYHPSTEPANPNTPQKPYKTSAARNRLTAEFFRDLTAGIEKQGLQDRVQLFLMTDPAEELDVFDVPTPVVLAIPSSVSPVVSRRKFGFLGRILGYLSVVLATVTLFDYSVSCYALNPKFFSSIVHQHNEKILSVCTPIFWGVIGIQLFHELVHVLIARNRGIRIGWPLPLASFELGSFGCLTAIRSFPKNRKDLFDFSIGGPAAAGVSSLAFMIVGIFKTLNASAEALAGFPVLPVASLKSSFLAGTLFTFLAPKVMSLPLSQPIPIHPLFVIGFSGLISSALNLLPVFRLDGGRALDAAMGHRHGEVISAAALMFLFSSVVSKGTAPYMMTWFLILVLFQRNHEVPSQDEVTGLCRLRVGGWICSLALSILALVPFPGFSRPLPSIL